MNDILLRYPARITSANRFRNLNHHAKGRISAEWREAFAWLARAARTPAFKSVGITIDVELTGGRQMDCDASAPCSKAAIDGLVDAGVIEDDKPPFVRWIRYNAPRIRCSEDALILTITRA